MIPARSESDSLANVTAMTDGFARATHPRLSPDGNWLVFQAVPPGESGFAVYVGHVRRSGESIVGMETPVRVSPKNTVAICPALSPDGITLLLAGSSDALSMAAPLPASMELYRADNFQSAVALADPTAGLNFTQHPITQNTAYDAEPDFCPDGKSVAFTSTRDATRAIFVMRPDGTGVIRLTPAPGDASSPAFSDDGKHLAYRLDDPATHHGQIAVATVKRNAAGDIDRLSNDRILTNPGELCLDPAWFPDGRHLVYTRKVGNRFDLYLMRLDGTGKTRLTFTSTLNVSPRFSIDGRFLFWTTLRGEARSPQLVAAEFHLPAGSD